MVTTAITFRIYNITFFQFGMGVETVYLVALYLSLIGNALFAEWLIARFNSPTSTETQKHNEHEKHLPTAAFSGAFTQRFRPEN